MNPPFFLQEKDYGYNIKGHHKKEPHWVNILRSVYRSTKTKIPLKSLFFVGSNGGPNIEIG